MSAAILAPIAFPWKVPLFAALALVIVWLETGSLEAVGLGKRRLLPIIGWAVVGWAIVALGIGQVVSPIVEELAGDLFKGQTDAPETLPEQQAVEPAEADDDLDTMKARLQAL